MSRHPWPWTLRNGPFAWEVDDASGNLVAVLDGQDTFAAIVAMRAEAYAAGQEAMRERVIELLCSDKSADKWSAAIMALPLQPETETVP
jgi:hypothetical protein